MEKAGVKTAQSRLVMVTQEQALKIKSIQFGVYSTTPDPKETPPKHIPARCRLQAGATLTAGQLCDGKLQV